MTHRQMALRTAAGTLALASCLAGGALALAGSAHAVPGPRIDPNDLEKPIAVIASGDQAHLVDSVTAGPLASTLSANILLVPQDRMVAETYAYLSEAHIQVVILVGGGDAISSVPESRIKSYGIKIYRLAGTDRYDTAQQIADVNDQALEYYNS